MLSEHTLGAAYGGGEFGRCHSSHRPQGGATVVDCTASDSTIPALLFAREQGYKVVLGQQKTADRFHGGIRPAHQSRCHPTWTAILRVRSLGFSRWETTVGAGLPVIATQDRIVASGDRDQADCRHVQRHAGLCDDGIAGSAILQPDCAPGPRTGLHRAGSTRRSGRHRCGTQSLDSGTWHGLGI